MVEPRFTVFEATNDTLKEIYVGMAAAGNPALQRVPGPEISHWKNDHAISYRNVEFSMAASHAVDCIAAHAKTLPKPGWTIIAGTPGFRKRPTGDGGNY